MFQFPEFNNPKLLACALTHSSCSNEVGFDANLESYERLEFLGDAVLSLVFAEILYHAKIDDPGKMTKIKSHVVSNKNLAKVCETVGLDVEARFGRSYTSDKSKSSSAKCKADILESYIGALYLDQGYDAARDFIVKVIPMEYSKQELLNPKGDLQEMVQAHHGHGLQYVLLRTDGPDHEKIFFSQVLWSDPDGWCETVGSGKSRKESEADAAKKAIRKYYDPTYGDLSG